MRTRIVLERDEAGQWDESQGYMDVSHDEPLTDEQAEVFREIGRLARERMTDAARHGGRAPTRRAGASPRL